jgi:hypothetical protein
MTNLFTVIANENDDNFIPTSREIFLRKAAKKLKEIERLEEKAKYHSLTREECEKINQKYFWSACFYPEEKKSPEKKKKNKKEEERKRKEEEMKRREKRKKEEELKRKEERKKEEDKKEEERKRKIIEILAKKTNTKINIEEEYRELLLLHNGNNNKTFRMLSLKYHPDKNVGKLEWANEMQKRLGVCKEIYSKMSEK